MFAARSSTYDSSARGPDPAAPRSRRRRGVRAGLAAAFALMVMAVVAPSASADPWQCDSFGYLVQVPTGSPTGIVQQVDLATGDYTTLPDPANPTQTDQLNAIGYNVLDNYFYAWDSTIGSIVQVNSDLTLTPVPTPAAFVAAGGSAIGDVDPAGHYWAQAGTSYYEIDYAPGSPTYGQVLSSGTLTPTGMVESADWVWVNGVLYRTGIDATGQVHLISVNTSTGVETDLGGAGFSASNFGAVYADPAGNLYGSSNDTGFIYRINIATRQGVKIANGPSAAGNDGARCASAPIPTVTVTKTVDGRVRPADQFTVGLVKPDGTEATSATTSGTATTASTIDFPASQGRTYTITDAMAGGSPTPLGEYVQSIACSDAAGNPVAVGGSGPSWTLTIADATNYTCNLTNRAVADIVFEKSASPTPVVPGDDVTWTMKVTNNGPSTAIGQTITDDLPDEVTFASASAGCSEANGVVTCAVGELAPGASQEFTVTAQVASSLDECLRNTASVAGPTFDPNTTNNTATICTPIEGRSNVAITKAASSATVAAGGQVMYTLVVRNNGPSDDPGVTVTDPLAAGLALVSASPSQGSCTTTNNVVSCDLGALRDGGSAQVLVTVNVTATSGCIPNTARVQGAHEDPNADNNQASAQVCVEQTVDPRFDLDVDKRTSTGRVVVGQRLTYTIVVRNNGPDAAPNAKVTDTYNNRATVVSVRTTAGTCTKRIPITCELGTIAAGDSVTITVVIKPRKSGRSRNAASATGDGTDTTPDNNMDTVDKTVRKVPLKITKVANSSSVQAGGTVNYRIRVRNPSKGEARNAKVCDRPQSGMRFVSSSPKAKRSRGQRCWTIKSLKARKSRTFRVTMRMADGANGRKVNRATVNGAQAKAATARRPVRVRGVATPVTG